MANLSEMCKLRNYKIKRLREKEEMILKLRGEISNLRADIGHLNVEIDKKSEVKDGNLECD